MQNHGLIVHGETADHCLALHSAVNARFADYFRVAADSFQTMDLEAYIASRLQARHYDGSFFLETPLYPDQMVFFIGTLGFGAGEPQTGEILLDLTSGEIRSAAGDAKTRGRYRDPRSGALYSGTNREKRVYAVNHEKKAKSFIANWESEKYRNLCWE
jgi:hypothetical protein